MLMHPSGGTHMLEGFRPPNPTCAQGQRDAQLSSPKPRSLYNFSDDSASACSRAPVSRVSEIASTVLFMKHVRLRGPWKLECESQLAVWH